MVLCKLQPDLSSVNNVRTVADMLWEAVDRSSLHQIFFFSGAATPKDLNVAHSSRSKATAQMNRGYVPD